MPTFFDQPNQTVRQALSPIDDYMARRIGLMQQQLLRQQALADQAAQREFLAGQSAEERAARIEQERVRGEWDVKQAQAQVEKYLTMADAREKARLVQEFQQRGYTRKQGETEDQFIARANQEALAGGQKIVDELNLVEDRISELTSKSSKWQRERTEEYAKSEARKALIAGAQAAGLGQLAAEVATGRKDWRAATQDLAKVAPAAAEEVFNKYETGLVAAGKEYNNMMPPEFSDELRKLTRQQQRLGMERDILLRNSPGMASGIQWSRPTVGPPPPPPPPSRAGPPLPTPLSAGAGQAAAGTPSELQTPRIPSLEESGVLGQLAATKLGFDRKTNPLLDALLGSFRPVGEAYLKYVGNPFAELMIGKGANPMVEIPSNNLPLLQGPATLRMPATNALPPELNWRLIQQPGVMPSGAIIPGLGY